MAVGSWTIEAKTPRLSRWRVSLANQPSTALAWEHEVEVISKLTRRLTNGLLRAHCPDGGLPGKLRSDWSADASWVCLTGNVQIAHCWLLLFEITGERRYLDVARRVNAWVRRRIAVDGPTDRRGGVKGSFPVDGDYGTYEYLNWACKFTIDANRLELQLSPRN